MTDATPELFELCLDDIPHLERLDRACFPPDRAFTAGYFYLLFLYDRAFGWGLRLNDEIIGFVLVTPHSARANIATLDIHPEQRRRGHASRLLEHCLTRLGEDGKGRVTLQVETTNTEALELYSTFGFRKKRILKDYYGGGDAYHMEKSI